MSQQPTRNQKTRSNKAPDYAFEVVEDHGKALMQVEIVLRDITVVTYIPVTDLLLEILRYYHDSLKQFTEKLETIKDEH